MKRTILFLFTIVMAIMVMAGDLTPQQALEQAQSFIKKREANGSRAKRAQGSAALRLTTKQVSGLYVFNIMDGGFVIVSNDDRTTPILGFSDSGNIDPDHMPSNMKAWLQGYADEIAWIKKNNISGKTSARASQRVGNHETTNIAPLIKTTWAQSAPYNNYCPEYPGYGISATGCVATAMAQVMNFHQWPTAATAVIPSYTSESMGKVLPALESTTFDWTNMLDSYSDSYTSTQATAVAKLMQYCGWSLEMNYGPESGAMTFMVANALKNYFDYSSATTQYVSRSFFSYANWTDMIYHELEQGRPVVYGGSSVDNGHCFVCDGYKYEEETDLFHINWGWNGLSDGYFVLSVLNPDEQGIGGSASNSAYNYGQDAVIGIQKTGGTGTVLDVPAKTINLKLESTSASHATIALGESVDVTIKVTNLSTDDYDGDLCIIVNKALSVGEMFNIPAGETQDCVINFTPSATGEYTLGAVYPSEDGGYMGFFDLGGKFTVVNQTPTDFTASNLDYYWNATIGWKNIGSASKWNLRSRSVNVIEEDFNGEVSGWDTQVINGKGWRIMSGAGRNSTSCYVSPSFEGGVDLDPNDALITPEVEFGGTLSFYAWGTNEHFRVFAKNDGDTKFRSITDVIATSTGPKLYTIDLSKYSGKGQVMINHCNSSGHTTTSYLYVDDVTIISPSGSWTIAENLTSTSYDLSGLAANKNYQVQAQAVNNNGGNWSAPFVFMTGSDALLLLKDDTSAEEKNTDLISIWNGHTAAVTLKDRTLKGNNHWNTICLPFDLPVYVLSFFGISTSDGSVKVLNTANSGFDASTGKLTLKFNDLSTMSTIRAGTPFILMINQKDDIELPEIPSSYNFMGFLTLYNTIKGDATALANMTQTSSDNNVKFVGQWSTFNITDENKGVILYIDSDNILGFSEEAKGLECFHAHFWVNSGGDEKAVRSIDTNLDGEDKTIYLVYTPGDADGDNTVDVNDVTSTINFILKKPVEKFIFEAADMDNDGKIDVNDVQAIIYKALGK